MSQPDFHSTDGISAHMVDGVTDDGTPVTPHPPQAFAAPTVADVAQGYSNEPTTDKHEGCADCKKQMTVLRSALIILALVIGALALLYLAQRKAHGHGDSQGTSTPDANN